MSTTGGGSIDVKESIGSDHGGEDAVHWAIVGLGDVCAVKAGPAFYKCRGSTLAAVMRRTPGAARAWIERNAADLPDDVAASVRAFDSVEQMMGEMAGKLDAVYVASPPGAHLDNVRQIVRGLPLAGERSRRAGHRRLKAVYVEKPCGRCAWETRAMVEELRARDVAFYPAYVSRAHERTQVLRELLGTEKVCGQRIVHIKYTQRGSSLARGLDVASGASSGSIPWRLVAEQSGGGLIMDMGCHVLDRLDYLFGPLENVTSTVSRQGLAVPPSGSLVENHVVMSATIGECNWSAVPSAGAVVECVWDFSPRGSRDRNSKESSPSEDVDELVITGPGGALRMAAMGAGRPIEVLDAEGRTVRTLRFDAPAHAAQPLIQAIVDELAGRREDRADGEAKRRPSARSPARAENAIRTAEVLDAILSQYYRGRHDEFWSRPKTWSFATV